MQTRQIYYIYTIRQIDLPLDNEFTKDIYESLLKGKKINRKYIHTKTDRLSVTLGFIFDINYKYSFEYLKDKKYFDTIVDIYKEKLNNEIFSNQLDEILKTINNYIEVNLCQIRNIIIQKQKKINIMNGKIKDILKQILIVLKHIIVW